MAKRPPQRTGANNRAPAMTDEQLDKAGLNPFLKIDHIGSPDDEAFRLTGWIRRRAGKFGEQLIVEVVQNSTGRTYDFAFGDGSPNHRKMFREMGRDEKAWAGGLTIKRVHNARSGGDMLHIETCEPDEPPF